MLATPFDQAAAKHLAKAVRDRYYLHGGGQERKRIATRFP